MALPENMAQTPLELVCGKVYKILYKYHIRKALFAEFCKQTLFGHSGCDSEENNTGRNADSTVQAQEVSFGNMNNTGSWFRVHLYHTFIVNLFKLCSYTGL